MFTLSQFCDIYKELTGFTQDELEAKGVIFNVSNDEWVITSFKFEGTNYSFYFNEWYHCEKW